MWSRCWSFVRDERVREINSSKPWGVTFPMSFSFDQSQTPSQGFNSGHAVGKRISSIRSYLSKNRSILFAVWTDARSHRTVICPSSCNRTWCRKSRIRLLVTFLSGWSRKNTFVWSASSSPSRSATAPIAETFRQSLRTGEMVGYDPSLAHRSVVTGVWRYGDSSIQRSVSPSASFFWAV